MEPFELIDHTAEIGIRAQGSTREDLFAHMAQGMFSLIVPLEEIRAARSVSIRAQADGWEPLLVSWLRELLFLFDTQHLLGKSFQIHRLEPTLVEATLSGEELDLSRHSVGREVKAVTYYDLSISQRSDGTWTAQVIFDV